MRLKDAYSDEEIQQLREAMEQLRRNQIASKEKIRQTYEELKRRHPEFWKAFGFTSEDEYLWHYDLRQYIKP